MNDYELGTKTSWNSIIINIILASIKLVAGIIGKSSAMIADGFHTLSDILTTFIVLLGLKVSSKEADENHPYGHEKFESVFAKIVSIFLIMTGGFIGYSAFSILISGDLLKPKGIALGAAIVSIVVKEYMYRSTMQTAKLIGSISMEADAWHHRSDVLSSIGTFAGILGARLGLTFLDPVAGIIVSVLIIKVGVELYIKSINELVDESASDETIAKIDKITNDIDGVMGIKDLKTRVFGNKVYVDLEIFVDGNITVKAGHEIAENVHDKLEKHILDIKHCMVHVEPFINL